MSRRAARAVDWYGHPNPFLSIAGRDRPARELLAQALALGALPVVAAAERQTPSLLSTDYAQIDADLPVEVGADVDLPPAGTGYAGLTAAQRGFFYNWLHQPLAPAGPVYERLYLAGLESHLFADSARAGAVRELLLTLLAEAQWANNPDLARTALLAGWLGQDGAYLRRVLATGLAPPSLIGVGLGWQALLGTPLDGDEALAAYRAWRGGTTPPVETEIVQLNIDSLAATLGVDPLRYALDQVIAALPAPGTDEPAPTSEDRQTHWPGPLAPWRSVHRELQVAMPQPDLRSLLTPLLDELVQSAASHPVQVEAEATEIGDTSGRSSPDWVLVLEFGTSTSQFYEYVVMVAQKQPNYSMLMDETRQMLHRLIFQKRQLRSFWRLWEYVQNWSSTKVYVNGQELEKWKIWPYSHYLR